MATSLQSGTNAKYKSVYEDESSFGSVLYLVTLAVYGKELLGIDNDNEPMWEPATILQEIEEDFGIKLPQGCFDRLMACMVITLTDLFYQDLPTFIHLCNILSGSPITEEFDPANVLEMSWAVTEALLLDTDPEDELKFSDDIKAYIVEACKEEGVLTPPPALARIVGSTIAELNAGSFTDDAELFQGVQYNQKVHQLENQIAVDSNIWKLYQQMRILTTSPEVQKKLTELQNEAAASIQAMRKKLADLATG